MNSPTSQLELNDEPERIQEFTYRGNSVCIKRNTEKDSLSISIGSMHHVFDLETMKQSPESSYNRIMRLLTLRMMSCSTAIDIINIDEEECNEARTGTALLITEITLRLKSLPLVRLLFRNFLRQFLKICGVSKNDLMNDLANYESDAHNAIAIGMAFNKAGDILETFENQFPELVPKDVSKASEIAHYVASQFNKISSGLKAQNSDSIEFLREFYL